MIELFLACALLLDCNLLKYDRYEEYLNREFLKQPENDLLLDLQCCYSDYKKSVDTINYYLSTTNYDYKIFGKYLMKELKFIYLQNIFDIKIFSKRTYLLWKHLPFEISQDEPFHVMSYADDPLSYGDENQTRSLYEKMFEYYE